MLLTAHRLSPNAQQLRCEGTSTRLTSLNNAQVTLGRDLLLWTKPTLLGRFKVELGEPALHAVLASAQLP
jgi:hypothetical protein